MYKELSQDSPSLCLHFSMPESEIIAFCSKRRYLSCFSSRSRVCSFCGHLLSSLLFALFLSIVKHFAHELQEQLPTALLMYTVYSHIYIRMSYRVLLSQMAFHSDIFSPRISGPVFSVFSNASRPNVRAPWSVVARIEMGNVYRNQIPPLPPYYNKLTYGIVKYLHCQNQARSIVITTSGCGFLPAQR